MEPATLAAIRLSANNLLHRWGLVTERVGSHSLHFLPTNHVNSCTNLPDLELLLQGNHPSIQIVLFKPEIRNQLLELIVNTNIPQKTIDICVACQQ